jgi:CxxC motif-containing protein (DUF1111 family)
MVNSSLRWTPWLVLALATACVVLPPPPPGTVIDHPPDPNAPARAGGPLPGLTAAQLALFKESAEAFNERDTVTGSGDTSRGLGPRFNLDACAGCHAFPAVGGSSGPVNPQPVFAKADGATNDIDLPFLHADGPIMEVRFKSLMDADGNFLTQSGKRRPDGGVHQLFTITGRTDAGGCAIRQPPFKQAWVQNNVTLRMTTPLFGLGLIEAISESTIRANSLETMQDVANAKRVVNGRALDFNADYYEVGVARDRLQMYRELGIVGRPGRGRENRSGNDSTITRFGWKAQNKSLLLFAGEAYNVEQGVTNELFTNERDTEALPLPDACKGNATPEDDTKFDQLNEPPSPGSADSRVEDFAATAGDLVKFELFMRMLAPPKPACDMAVAGSCSPNIVHGSQVFDEIHCSACHVRGLKVGASSIAAIAQQQVANLYSDLLLHKMGACPPNADHTPNCLADDISQGQAQGDEFRTAPLWGVGQRLFFLHDGRAHDLPSAILAHKGPGSEANVVIRYYEQLPASSKQELIDFLRSL